MINIQISEFKGIVILKKGCLEGLDRNNFTLV